MKARLRIRSFVGLTIVIVVLLGLGGQGLAYSIGPPMQGRLTGPVFSIEIDDRDGLPGTAGTEGEENANYTSTHGPAVPHGSQGCGVDSDDQDCPPTAAGDYGDWDDIGIPVADPPDLTYGIKGNHKVVDGIGNSDPTIFSPASCIADGSALAKQDITEIYLANNDEYFYFGQARRGNNGSSQFYWLLTQEPPELDPAPCPGDKQELRFMFTAGDVRVRIGFPSSPNSSQELVSNLSYHTYTGGDTGYIPAADAVNEADANPAWVDTTGTAVVNYALNTTPIPPPSSGTNSQLTKKNGGQVDLVEFAEGAIDLYELLGDTICGKTLYVSVITRPSESATSDLKDLLGPIEYSFGGVEATATLTATCDLTIEKEGYAEDASGQEITDDDAFEWWFYKCEGDGCDGIDDEGNLLSPADDTLDGTAVGRGNGYTVGGAGTYFAALKVTEPGAGGCYDYAASNEVVVYAPLDATANLDPSCTLDVPYQGSGSGGSGEEYDYSWDFSLECSGTSDIASGSVGLNDPGGSCRGDLTVTDAGRVDDLVCTADADSTAEGYVPLDVVALLEPSCNMGVGELDDAWYSIDTLTGGSPAGVSYDWSFWSACDISPVSSDAESDGLDVTPPALRGPCVVNAQVTVTDLRTDIVCDDTSDPVETTVYAPILVDIWPDTNSLTCELDEDAMASGVIYDSDASGGDGNYSYAWSNDYASNEGDCGSLETCVVDFPDSDYCATATVDVTVSDTSMCPAVTSDPESVTKVTEITATGTAP